jgi:hypothetical protein
VTIWAVKVRKTGCRVGTLRMAIKQSHVEFQRHPPLSFRAMMRREIEPPKIERVSVDFDHAKGVAWVERADSLIGMSGYEMD